MGEYCCVRVLLCLVSPVGMSDVILRITFSVNFTWAMMIILAPVRMSCMYHRTVDCDHVSLGWSQVYNGNVSGTALKHCHY